MSGVRGTISQKGVTGSITQLGILGSITQLGVVGSISEGGFLWSIYWETQSEVLFFAEISNITDGKLYNQKTGATDYLTVTGAAGSYTFECPNTAPYIAADTDYIWFNTDESQRIPTEAELIGYDLQRTPVKYLDDSPNSIEAIMILSSAVTGSKLNRMFKDFHLSIFWNDSLNIYGYVKSNRGSEQSVWTPESVSPYEDVYNAMTNKPTALITAAQQTLVDTLVTGGVWDKLDRFFVTAQYSNSDGEALLDWIDPTRSATTTGSPAWVSLEGFTGAAGKYLRSGFNPASGTNKFTINDNSFGFYNRANKAAADQIEIGSSISGVSDHDCAVEARYTGDVSLAKNCCTTWQSTANSDARGLFVNTRLLSTEFKLYKNKVGATYTINSANMANMEFFLLSSNNKSGVAAGTSIAQDSLFFFGSGLTQADVDCLTDAFEVYMDSNGKGIIT